MTRRALFVLLVAILLVSACSRSTQPVRDDFSDPTSGWGAGASNDYTRGYQEGRYYMRIDTNDWFIWTSAGKTYRDVTVRVSAFSEETRDNTYGVLCRVAKNRFYYFAISADGFYGIYRHEADGKLSPLTGPTMQRHPAIHTDGSPNQLEARCEGSQLSLSVNGVALVTVDDDALQRGQIGLAGSKGRDTRPAIIWFDNLEVAQP